MALTAFLAEQNYGQYDLKFKIEEIDVESLSLLSPRDLRSICGVPLGHGAKLVHAAQQAFASFEYTTVISLDDLNGASSKSNAPHSPEEWPGVGAKDSQNSHSAERFFANPVESAEVLLMDAARAYICEPGALSTAPVARADASTYCSDPEILSSASVASFPGMEQESQRNFDPQDVHRARLARETSDSGNREDDLDLRGTLSLASNLASQPTERLHMEPNQVISGNSHSLESNKLPQGLLQESIVQKQLFVAGVLPKEMVHHRCLYRLFCKAAVLAECFSFLLHLKACWMANDWLAPASFFIWQAFLVHPLWRTWVKELAGNSPTVQLLQQMDRRGYPWAELRKSIRISQAFCLASGATLTTYWYWNYMSGNASTQALLSRNASSYDRVLRTVAVVIDVIGIPSQFLWICVIAPSHVWIVCFLAHLHRFDLLCYAAAVAKAFEADMVQTNANLVGALKTLEVAVTARLRLASDRWVLFVIYYCVVLAVLILVLCMSLLNGELHAVSIVAVTAFAIFGALLLVALIAPLAMVAESFEYEVVRSLNNASILKAAQKHLGQQLLPHLKHLDWGFRFGGSTITAKMVWSIFAGVLLTLVTSVSQAAFDQANVV